MDNEFYQEIIKYKPKLFAAIMKDFASAQEITYKSEDYLTVFNLDLILEKPELKAHLSTTNENYSWDYARQSDRLALLSSEDLELLALYFGTAIHAKSIAKKVVQKEVLALRAEMGEDLYFYALVRGQYQLGELSTFFLKRNLDLNLFDRIKLHGQQSIELVAQDWTFEQKKKLPLFFSGEEITKFNANPKFAQKIYFGLKKILIKEISSEWQECLD